MLISGGNREMRCPRYDAQMCDSLPVTKMGVRLETSADPRGRECGCQRNRAALRQKCAEGSPGQVVSCLVVRSYFIR